MHCQDVNHAHITVFTRCPCCDGDVEICIESELSVNSYAASRSMLKELARKIQPYKPRLPNLGGYGEWRPVSVMGEKYLSTGFIALQGIEHLELVIADEHVTSIDGLMKSFDEGSMEVVPKTSNGVTCFMRGEGVEFRARLRDVDFCVSLYDQPRFFSEPEAKYAMVKEHDKIVGFLSAMKGE